MTHIKAAAEDLIPKGESQGVEYAADVLDYGKEVFDVSEDGDTREVYEHRFVAVPAATPEEALGMLNIFNKGIQDTTGHEPVLYKRTVTYGEWTRVDG